MKVMWLGSIAASLICTNLEAAFTKWPLLQQSAMDVVHATMGSVYFVVCLRERLWLVLELVVQKVEWVWFRSEFGEGDFGGCGSWVGIALNGGRIILLAKSKSPLSLGLRFCIWIFFYLHYCFLNNSSSIYIFLLFIENSSSISIVQLQL